MKIIDILEKANIIYIHSIEFDINEKKIIINFIQNPENQVKIIKRLVFYNIKTFSDEIDEDDYDEDCLDSLIGLQEINVNQFIKYIVTTEQREIEIQTENVPLLENVD